MKHHKVYFPKKIIIFASEKMLMLMKVVMDWMKSLCPLSDETVRELEACVTPCRFPKRHLLVREGIYCKYAYFIEKGMTRSYWLVDGEEITTSFAGDG